MAKLPKAGRPKLAIDWDLVDRCFESGCTGEMTAAAVGVHYDTLAHRIEEEKGMLCSDYSALKKRKGNSKIFLKQQEVAEGGDRGMLIWLGKNRLGQRDDPQLTQKLDDHLSRFNQFIEKIKPEENNSKGYIKVESEEGKNITQDEGFAEDVVDIEKLDFIPFQG